MIEPQLRQDLLTVARAFAEGRGIQLSTASQILHQDRTFFGRLEKEKGSFTAKTYDAIMQRASNLWPKNCEWPVLIARPEPESAGSDSQPKPGGRNGKTEKARRRKKRKGEGRRKRSH